MKIQKTSLTTSANRKLQNRTFLGVVLMLAGLALYPLADAFIKHLMGIYSVQQATFLRAMMRLVPLFLATFFQGGPARVLGTSQYKRHGIRLAVNLCYTYAFMYAFSCGSLTVIYT